MLGPLQERRRNIVSDVRTIIRERQLAIRREIDRRGIHLKAVAYDSGLDYDTLRTYFPGGDRVPAELPASAIYCLRKAVPADLLNLLEPEGWAVVRVPDGIDYDHVSELCRGFISTKDRFHHPESEAGRDLGPTEREELGCKVIELRGRVA
jgi:hypothetical protein